MTVLDTRISCFDTTWNPTFGCDKVSPGCDHCYAEIIANRFHGGFHLRLMPHRLADIRRFGPLERNGRRVPRRVFVNSMSDLFHRDVPDAYIDQVFDALATQPLTAFLVLTKRAEALARYARRRWGDGGVPENVWLGVTVEDQRLRARARILRDLKGDIGPFTAIACLEPLLGPVDRLDLAAMDWVIMGGETGGHARPLDPAWVRQGLAAAQAAGAAVWFKAWGRWPSNPLWAQARGRTQRARKHDLIARGLELAPEEQGGATLDGRLVRDMPAAYHRLAARL
ncbi:MAG: DUF5131 family protein [Rhodobacterales bacterium]|nr:DUF5131 family protein [Rhodobacterales bacterium]